MAPVSNNPPRLMNDVASSDLRNFAVLGHASAGKTILCEAMLACAGNIGRMGSIAAGMAGLAGGLYGTVQQVVGTTDFDIFPGIIFVLFVTIWGIRTVSGAFLAALTFVALNQIWPSSIGIFAGMGVILIGRAANGILGIEALHFRLPWVKAPVGPSEPTGPLNAFGGAALATEGTRAVG